MKYLTKLGLALLLIGMIAGMGVGDALAHGRRTIGNGKFEVVIGFLNEPAFANSQNGIDLTICQGKCENNADGTLKNPVKEADKTIKAEVINGSQTLPIQLTPRFRADGKYNGVFFPSKAGEYTFHLSGMISGEAIDERFVSSKDGFNSVEEPTFFPATQSGTTNLEQQIKEANDKAGLGTTLGIAGIIAGLLGLGVGAFGLRRQSAVTSAASTNEPIGSGRGRGPQGG